MQRFVLALFAGVLLLGLVPGSALGGTAAVDQANTATTIAWSSPDFVVAQTFRAGTSGVLDSVDMYWGGTGTATVTLEGTTGSPPVPSGPELATASLTLPVPDYEWVRFYFSTSYPVTAGQSYALVFSTGSSAGVYGSADLYSRGRALITHTGTWAPLPSVFAGGVSDFSFATYVAANLATPTPTLVRTATPQPTRAPTPTPAPATARPTVAPTSTPPPAPTMASSAAQIAASGAAESPSAIGVVGATGTPDPVSGAGSAGSGSGSGGSGGSGGSAILVVAVGIVVLLLLAGASGFVLKRRRRRTAI